MPCQDSNKRTPSGTARQRTEGLRRAAVAALPAPAPPSEIEVERSLIEVTSAGHWAVGKLSNCRVAGKVYALSEDGARITWRSGTGP